MKDVTIESFNDPPSHTWVSVNDPVMGGLSTATFTVVKSHGVFAGEVKDVPSLQAPGFISARTPRTGSWFPDLTSCDAFKLRVRSTDSYDGYRMSFGTNFAGTMQYAHGYKAHFNVPIDSGSASEPFHEVLLQFTDFSDNWDPKTGNVIVSCADNEQYCPDDATLANMVQMEFMAEGVSGTVRLEIDSIQAINCDDSVVETDPNPEETAKNSGSGGGGYGNNRGQFGGRNYSGNLDRDKNAVGGYGGYMYPTILPNGDVRIESFDNPKHRWYPVNDPVMGGSSMSSVTVLRETGIFDGEVVDVPRLDAPGFIKMETRGGNFPDVSMCRALKLTLKSANDYTGIRVTLGRHHADDAQPWVRGYKAHLTEIPMDGFGEVIMPFSDFSDKWDPRTGDTTVSCKEDKIHCPDEATLVDFTTFSFMGEGVDGKVHLEVKTIDATDCNHSAKEYQKEDAYKGEGFTGFTYAGILVGFLVVGAVNFFAGRKYERERRYNEPSGADGISLPPSVEVEQGYGSTQDDIVMT